MNIGYSKEDIERITENVVKQLSIEIGKGGFTDPNSRSVVLKLGNKEISRTYFDVVQVGEYEG